MRGRPEEHGRTGTGGTLPMAVALVVLAVLATFVVLALSGFTLRATASIVGVAALVAVDVVRRLLAAVGTERRRR